MSIKDEVLVVNLQLGIWQGYKLDRTATQKVTSEADASNDAARVNKHLVPKEAIAEVSSAATALRLQFHAKTLPWKDNGDRLLPRKMFNDFMLGYQKLRDTYDAAVEEFLNVKYPSTKAQAEFRMGAMFDSSDYPDSSALRHKFYVNLDVDGVPNSYDFRLNNDDAMFQARVTKAVDSLWRKLAEPLEALSDKMTAGEGARIHATILSNLRDVAEVIPQLNFTDDPQLELVRKQIDAMLARYDIADVRKDDKVRDALGAEATEIVSIMKGFMTAMGSNNDE